MKRKIGINVSADEVISLLSRMSLVAERKNEKDQNQLKVIIPPTRHDILHECDIAEDIALAFGYNEIQKQLPKAHTVAQPFPLNKLSDQLRSEIANAGWTEVLNFALCSIDDISRKLNRPDGAANSVKIANPKTSEFQVARNSLLPGLLKTLANNKDLPLPLKLFELQDVVLKDSSKDTNSKNERHAAAVFYNKTGSFEIIHGLLDRVMEVLGIPFSQQPDSFGYSIQGKDDATFFPGRAAEIVIRKPGGLVEKLGIFGILHPDVLANFSLTMPCCALEFNVEYFV